MTPVTTPNPPITGAHQPGVGAAERMVPTISYPASTTMAQADANPVGPASNEGSGFAAGLSRAGRGDHATIEFTS